MNIGYIGLGAMGGALARRLMHTHKLIVWDVNSAAAAAFDGPGAVVASSAAELARQCDIVLLCLPRTSDVRHLVFGTAGLAEGLAAGKLVIDQTSGVPHETREIAAELAGRGVRMIDAPVSGGPVGAMAGTITIMASGSEISFQSALPVLRSISPNVFFVGSRVGDGQAMKLVNNLLSFGCRLATLEVVAMGRKLGLTLEAITDVINKGSARSRTSTGTLQDLVDGDLPPSTFTLSLMLKDLSQVIQLAMECGVPTTIANVARGLVQIGVNTLGENAQLNDLLGLIESMAGTRFLDPSQAAAAKPDACPRIADPKALRVGYVGLGTMGGAIARQMMLSRKIRVFDARAEIVRAFEAEGAVAAPDLRSLAQECDVIFICVPNSAVVEEVIFGKRGLAEGLSPGKIVVDQTTGDPSMTRRIAADLQKLGVQTADAPVGGGARGAVAGTLAIMCGGPADACAALKPILESVSPNIVHCGRVGSGHEAKLIHNALSTSNCLLTYEAASIAVKYGLKLSDVAKVINTGGGWSAASERILPTLSAGKATADFQLHLQVKDLKLVARMAMDCGAPILIPRAVCSLYEVGMYKLGGTANIDTMAQLFESMADIRFVGA